MKTYTLFEDALHAWLSISHKEAIKAGIKDKISGFSYMDNTRIYLEEDRDKWLFLDTLKTEYRIKSSYKDRSPIRNKAGYNPKMVGYIPETGDILTHYNNAKYKVKRINKKYIYLEDCYCLLKSIPKYFKKFNKNILDFPSFGI